MIPSSSQNNGNSAARHIPTADDKNCQKRDRLIKYTILIFIVFATIYFLPKPILKAFLPTIFIKYRIVFPLLTLTIAGVFLLPWQMTLAMLFSMAGDFRVAYGSFLWQMGFFALAHIMLISWFDRQFMTLPKDKTFIRLNPSCKTAGSSRISLQTASISICTFIVLSAFAFICIIPYSPAGITRAGCSIYAILICTMMCISITLRRPLLFIGAALFLFSDMILSWNKFVSPVPAHRWLIMLPYYGGQLLLWLGATKKIAD